MYFLIGRFRVAAVYSNNDNKLSQNSYKFFLHQGMPTERSRLVAPTSVRAEAQSPSSIQIQWQVITPSRSRCVFFFLSQRRARIMKTLVYWEKHAFVIFKLLIERYVYSI